MNPIMIFDILELALGIAKNVAAGTKAEGDFATIIALEQIVAKAMAAYQAEAGQPLDLTKLTPEDPIP